MTKLYVSDLAVEELKNKISSYGSNELELDEFEFFIRSFNIDETNDYLLECVFDDNCYDLFDIDEFALSLNNAHSVGYNFFFDDGSVVLKAWGNGSLIADISEPDNEFEVSAVFKMLFPKVSNFEAFLDEYDRRTKEGQDEMLVALMKEQTKVDPRKKLSQPKEQLFSVCNGNTSEIKDFEVADFGDGMDINGTDFYYWA